jgi:hypothetical protein
LSEQRIGAAEHEANLVARQVPAGAADFLAAGEEDERGNGLHTQRLDTGPLTLEIHRFDAIAFLSERGDRRLCRATRASRIHRDVHEISILGTRCHFRDNRVLVHGHHNDDRQQKRDSDQGMCLVRHGLGPTSLVKLVRGQPVCPPLGMYFQYAEYRGNF